LACLWTQFYHLNEKKKYRRKNSAHRSLRTASRRAKESKNTRRHALTDRKRKKERKSTLSSPLSRYNPPGKMSKEQVSLIQISWTSQECDRKKKKTSIRGEKRDRHSRWKGPKKGEQLKSPELCGRRVEKERSRLSRFRLRGSRGKKKPVGGFGGTVEGRRARGREQGASPRPRSHIVSKWGGG